MTGTRRPFSPAERNALVSALRGPRRFKDYFLAYMLALVLALLLLTLAFRFLGPPRDPWEGIAVGAALLLAFLGPLYLRRDLARLSARYGNLGALQQDLQGGEVEEVAYDAVDAIQVQETEDLGSNYYIRLDDGLVLFLSGQYLYELEENRQFPSTRFTLVHTPHAKLFLDLRVSGTYLPPTTVRPRFTDQQYRNGEVPTDGDLLKLDFESLRTGAA